MRGLHPSAPAPTHRSAPAPQALKLDGLLLLAGASLRGLAHTLNEVMPSVSDLGEGCLLACWAARLRRRQCG